MSKTNSPDEYRSIPPSQQIVTYEQKTRQVYEYQQPQDGYSETLARVNYKDSYIQTTNNNFTNATNPVNSNNYTTATQGQVSNYSKPPYVRPPPIHVHQQSSSVNNQTYFSGTTIPSIPPPPYDDQGRVNNVAYQIYPQQQLEVAQQQQHPYGYQLPVSQYPALPPPSQQSPPQQQQQQHQQTDSLQTPNVGWQAPVNSHVHYSLNVDVNQYPDITSMVNSNVNVPIPLVETHFVDHRTCTVCGKRITRDMSRHMRTHQSESRFKCKFPRSQCIHKSGKFNRPYDYKKHLLNRHFKFDDESVKRLHNLNEKLDHWGVCPCGLRFVAKDWLDLHILTEEVSKMCPFIEQR